MASVMIELSDEAMKLLLERGQDDIGGFISDLITTALGDDGYEFHLDPSGKLSPEDLESVGRGLAQLDAGQGRPGDEVFAELFARVGLTFRG